MYVCMYVCMYVWYVHVSVKYGSYSTYRRYGGTYVRMLICTSTYVPMYVYVTLHVYIYVKMLQLSRYSQHITLDTRSFDKHTISRR